MSPYHYQSQPDRDTVLQSKSHAYNAKMEPIYQRLCAGAVWGGNKLNLKNSLSPIRVVMYINEM